MPLKTHWIGKRGLGSSQAGLELRTLLSASSAVPPSSLLSPSARAGPARLWAGSGRLGSPTGKTRFSRSRLRPDGNRLDPPPPSQALRVSRPPRSPAGFEETLARSWAAPGSSPPTPVATPRPYLASASCPRARTRRSFNGGEGRPTAMRGAAAQRPLPLPHVVQSSLLSRSAQTTPGGDSDFGWRLCWRKPAGTPLGDPSPARPAWAASTVLLIPG